MEIIHIDENQVKIVETTEIVINLGELRSEISDLDNQINSIQYLEYPPNASDKMKIAIDSFNEKQDELKEMLIAQKLNTQSKLDLCL